MTTNKHKIYPHERQVKILGFIKDSGSASVEQLAEHFSVTSATIRTDLRNLEKRNLIARTHGGAIVKDVIGEFPSEWKDPSYHNRTLQNLQYKEAIGREVGKLVRNGDSIMLDDGSTNLQIARFLPTNINITVVTNGLNICLELSEHANVEVIETGGILNKTDLSYYGKITEEVVAKFYTNLAVLGASAITPENGLMAPDERKAELKKHMMRQTQRLVIAADHTKLDRISMVPVCPVTAVHTLVTDADAPGDVVSKFRDRGVNVVLAEKA